MKYYIAIDDTDNLESIGTGEIAENLSKKLESLNFGKATPVSRHQLYFHDAIAYTSHNSSMCFELLDSSKSLKELIKICSDYLEKNCAVGSDPGLCIVEEDINEKNKIIKFGKRAKVEILNKEESYQLAENLNIHLSEHGGDGSGIIGALAGVGLRMDGNDGRYKGKIKISKNQDNMLVKDILQNPKIQEVRDEKGYLLGGDEEVFITERVKTVRLNNKSVLLVEKVIINEREYWKNIEKKYLKRY